MDVAADFLFGFLAPQPTSPESSRVWDPYVTTFMNCNVTRAVIVQELFRSLPIPSSYPTIMAALRRAMVKILLIGDSLTEGFYHHGMRFHSYGVRLEERLAASIGPKFSIDQRGVSGEETYHMAKRLHHILAGQPADEPFDIVCVLGGTNDLADDANTPETIFHNLEAMYTSVHNHNNHATLVPITIPQSFVRDEGYLANRAEVNRLILNYRRDDPLVVPVDLEHLLPYYGVNQLKDDEYWDDGLHMTPKGYDKLGDFVYQALSNRLQTM